LRKMRAKGDHGGGRGAKNNDNASNEPGE